MPLRAVRAMRAVFCGVLGRPILSNPGCNLSYPGTLKPCKATSNVFQAADWKMAAQGTCEKQRRLKAIGGLVLTTLGFFLPQLSRHTSQSTKLPELKFRALLADGTREVRFERMTAI